jgi:AcrR family transcriptional regulator
LLSAAREVFLRHGYADTTAGAISTAAGVGYGSFYVYFSSKEEIFVEVAHDMMEAVYRDSRAPQEQLDPAARLVHENRRYFQLYRDNAALFDLLQEAIRADDTVRAAWQQLRMEYIGRLARSLSKLQAEGVLDAGLDARYVAECLGAMAERTAYLSTVDSSFDVTLLEETMSQVWINALGLSVTTPRPSRPRRVGPAT